MADNEYSNQGNADQENSQSSIRDLSDGQMHAAPQLEVHTGKPHRVQVKITIPVKEHPSFNFVGKLLGPKGSSLKQLQEMTQTRMAILGRGSMRDKKKEEELRIKGEPKYLHLNEELHVEITAYAPPSEAYRRIAAAIDEVARFLVPDYDEMRQYPMGDMPVNGSRGRGKPPGYGYDDPIAPGPPPPPPPGPAPQARNPAYWSGTPPVRGAAPRRVLQPRPAAGASRRLPPGGATDYPYEDPYSSYESAGARGGDYYTDQVLEEGDVNFAADDYYGTEPPRSAVGPARSPYPRARAHPYAAAARPY